MRTIAFWKFLILVLITVCLFGCDQARNISDDIIRDSPDLDSPDTSEADEDVPIVPVVEPFGPVNQTPGTEESSDDIGELLATIETLGTEIKELEAGSGDGGRDDGHPQNDDDNGDDMSTADPNGDSDDMSNDNGDDMSTADPNGDVMTTLEGEETLDEYQRAALQKFSKDDRVVVINTLDLGLRIRGTPNGTRIGGMFNGETGTIISDPRIANKYVWFEIEWDRPVKNPNSGCGDRDVCIGWSVAVIRDGTKVLGLLR